jgi:hypothetical protein
MDLLKLIYNKAINFIFTKQIKLILFVKVPQNASKYAYKPKQLG